MQKKYHTQEFLRTTPHLRTRVPFNTTLLRLRSDCIAEITSFLAHECFTQTHTPIITSSDCEGAGEVFHVATSYKGQTNEKDDGSFFRAPKYLTVSSQLHLEALAQSVGNVWTLSPTFRAEKSDTKRHLSEFYMLELEMSFVEDMSSIMDMVQRLVQRITEPLLSSRVGKEILSSKARDGHDDPDALTPEQIKHRWCRILAGPWPRITYTEAIETLISCGVQFKTAPEWGIGLGIEHEQYLAGIFDSPVFVTHYPKTIKPFYMLQSTKSVTKGDTVDCFDLLLPQAGELVGGSMREHRIANLINSMQSTGMIPAGSVESLNAEQLGALKWYVDLRRWGSVPHGGFGLGFDRLLGYLAGVPNIRDINTFPRWVGRCEC
jgi:asparaginyl-tRNA synthetase